MIGLVGSCDFGTAEPAPFHVPPRDPHDSKPLRAAGPRFWVMGYNGRKPAHIVETGELTMVAVGDVFDDEVQTKYGGNIAAFIRSVVSVRGLAAGCGLNGSYAFFVIHHLENWAVIGTDRNSFIPAYYAHRGSRLRFSWDIWSLRESLDEVPKLNERYLMAWLLIGGRGFFDYTVLEGVQCLEPGSAVVLREKELEKIRPEPFHFTNGSLSETDLVDAGAAAIVTGVRRRSNHEDGNLIGLSGGIDSRIVLAAAAHDDTRSWMAYTFGVKDFQEAEIARKVARLFGISHSTVEVSPFAYIRYAIDGIRLSGGASLFKHGVLPQIFRLLSEKLGAADFVLGSALDLVLGGTHSQPEVYEMKNRSELLDYYCAAGAEGDIKNPLLFNFTPSEWATLCLDETYARGSYSDTVELLGACIAEIPGDDPADVNDALAFDIRIKRWYNRNLVYPLRAGRVHTPTYDTDFLDVVAQVPSNLRRNSTLRIALLQNLCPSAADLPIDSTMQPASLPPEFRSAFENNVAQVDSLKSHTWFESGGKVYLPSRRFDANFLDWFRVYPEYDEFARELLVGNDSILAARFFKRSALNRLLDDHKSGRRALHKVLMLLVSAEIMCRQVFGETESIRIPALRDQGDFSFEISG